MQTRAKPSGLGAPSDDQTHRPLEQGSPRGPGGTRCIYMWGEVLYGAGHQYDTALLPALVRQRPFGGLWPPEEPPAARSARKRPRAAHGARPEAATHHGVVGVGAGSYGFCSPAAPATTTTGLMQGGVLPKPVSIPFRSKSFPVIGKTLCVRKFIPKETNKKRHFAPLVAP